GQHDDVAGSLVEHAGQEVRTGVDLQVPVRRPVAAVVEPGDTVEMSRQVGAEWRVDMHPPGHTAGHLLLKQGRVAMARIQCDQPNWRHCSAPHGCRTSSASNGRPTYRNDMGCSPEN